MDLLGGYGSGSDSEPVSPGPQAATGTATLLSSSLRVQAAPPVAQEPPSDPSQLLSSLPPPSGAKPPLFSGLPKPAQKKKVVVQFRVPITYNPADVKGAAEEEPARKRQKASSRGRSLAELLPAPKNAATGGGRRLDVLGAGAAGGSGTGRKYDSDDDEIVPGTEDRSGMVELGPGDAPGPATADGNEAFRVDAAGGAAATAAAAAQYDAAQQEQYAAWQAYYQQHGGHEYNQHQQAAAAAAATTSAADPAEAMLQAALAAEREKAVRRGLPVSAGSIEIKEVRGDQLKAMDPGQRAGVNAIRNALGTEYEAKLRKEAGSDPSKLSKRRHQIGSLYHYAKQKELEQLEVRAVGSKTKAETQKKYGW